MLDKSITQKKTITKETALAVLDDLVAIGNDMHKIYVRDFESSKRGLEAHKTVHSPAQSAKNRQGDILFHLNRFNEVSPKIDKLKKKLDGKVVMFRSSKEEKLKELERDRNDSNDYIRGNKQTTSFATLTYYMADCHAAGIEPDKALKAEYKRRTSPECPESEQMNDMSRIKNIREHYGQTYSLGQQIKQLHENQLRNARESIEENKKGIAGSALMAETAARIKTALENADPEIEKTLLDDVARKVCVYGCIAYGGEIPAFTSFDEKVKVRGKGDEILTSTYMSLNPGNGIDCRAAFVYDRHNILANMKEISEALPAQLVAPTSKQDNRLAL